MAREVSSERKAAYYGGAVLIGIGLLVFASTFFELGEAFVGPGAFFARPLLGMALIVAGAIVRSIGARGLAGSGVLLDPQRAREDLEPYARMAGSLAQDALEETGLAGKAREVVMLECPACQRRNEADARFCQGCGRAL